MLREAVKPAAAEGFRIGASSWSQSSCDRFHQDVHKPTMICAAAQRQILTIRILRRCSSIRMGTKALSYLLSLTQAT